MKRVRKSSLPRPVKALLFLLAALSLVLVIYILLGAAPMSLEAAFRRAERGHLIGPSRILGSFSQAGTGEDNVIIAETDNLYILYYDHSPSMDYRRFFPYTKPGEIYYDNLVCYEKSESMALYHVPCNSRPLNLVLFDQEPRAVRAIIELELSYSYSDTNYTMPIRWEATREHEGFFLFSFSIPDDAPHHWNSAESQLQIYCSQYHQYGMDKPQVTIHLYDPNGDLISTQTILPGPMQ